jgi:peptide chain release factor 1
MFSKLEEIVKKYNGLCKRMQEPGILADIDNYKGIAKEITRLEPIVKKYGEYKKIKNEINGARRILAGEKDADIIGMANSEITENTERLGRAEEELKVLLLPRDERDDANVILEIRPAAGGEEATLFAGVLLRMYAAFAAAQGFSVEIADIDETGIGGIKTVTAIISGSGAYSQFKFESGVHRVQRVPETEAQGRIHTSTATVAVLPEATAVDFKIDEKDLRIDVYRASGAGGQHINKTESAVRITHLPTNMVVACQDQRSQFANKDKAMVILQTKLADYYQNLADTKYADERLKMVGTGDRSERIRTYNYPQGRITDHRINRTEYNLTAFINGGIGGMVEALRLADTQAKLQGK